MTPDTPAAANEADEVTYFHGSPSLRGAVGLFVFYGLLSIALIVGGLLLRPLGWWIPLVAFLLAAGLMALPGVLTRSTHYHITSYRIDYERGVLSKTIDTLELWHVSDIRFHQSLLDRLLRIGTITVLSSDSTTPCLPLRSIPDPRPIFESLKQRVITVKRQRGVIKLDGG